MCMNNDTIDVFSEQYREKGIKAQRLYPNEALLRFLGGRGFFSEDNSERKVLELGCGSGANLWMLAKEGFETYGLDGSREAVELAKVHLAEKWQVNADIRCGIFENLPYDDGMFDVVVDVVSLQHIDIAESKKALQEVYRVLKNGGGIF